MLRFFFDHRQFLLVIFLLCSLPLSAQFKDTCYLPEAVRFSDQPVRIITPSIAYGPETSWNFGIYSLFYFKMGEKGGCTRPSKIEPTVTYSLNKQLQIQPDWEIYFKHDNYLTSGTMLYQKYPELFYGIGDEAKEAEHYSHQLLKMLARGEKRLFGRVFAGVQYQMQYMWNVKPDMNGQLARRADDIAGSEGSFTSGPGFALTYDTRDLSITPTRGAYIDFSSYIYSRITGSDYSFTSLRLDARKYFRISNTILAFQAYGEWNNGDPPFRMLALLGNKQLMRGYYMGRYRDRDYMAFQSEYRFPVYGRIGLTVFGAVGEVAHNPRDFTIPGFHANYGFGFRYKYDKRQNVNIRVDFGFGEGNTGQYVTIGEAF